MGAVARTPYLQFWKQCWRARKPVPKRVRAAIGKPYLTRSLGTPFGHISEPIRSPITPNAKWTETANRLRWMHRRGAEVSMDYI